MFQKNDFPDVLNIWSGTARVLFRGLKFQVKLQVRRELNVGYSAHFDSNFSHFPDRQMANYAYVFLTFTVFLLKTQFFPLKLLLKCN